MVEIKAKQVYELRKNTGAPMMDCKAALIETDGAMEDAVDWLRTKGVAVAEKKSSRDTNQGLVGVHVRREDDGRLYSAIVEVNCETDFVARNETFQSFVTDYARRASMAATLSDQEIADLISKVGENVKIGSSAVLRGGSVMAAYVHNQVSENLGSMGVIVMLDGAPTDELAITGRDIAMHIAATNPRAVDESDLDAEWLARERRIFVEQAKESGKPDHIIEKMVDGKMKKVIRENTLIAQPFVKDPDKTVEQILAAHNATVTAFVRIAVGE